MWSRLFKKNGVEKNILVLGKAGCGKRSFLLCYKDGAAFDLDKISVLPEFHTLTYSKKLAASGVRVPLVFTLNSSHNDEMIPSIAKQVKYDLILVLTDLSSEQAKSDLDYYSKFAKIHFPNVKTILVGTKQDKKIDFNECNECNGLISASVKTKYGFEVFEEQLLQGLNLIDKTVLKLR